MNIANKLFGNPAIIGLILVAIMLIMTFPIILQIKKPYKWIYFLLISAVYTLIVPLVLITYECNKNSKISGGTIDTSSIFDISTPYNHF